VEQRPLGGTGIEVSRIALGCGNFGGIGSDPALFGTGETREEAFALMDAAHATGITLFDTADAYGGGRSERWVGDWLRERAPADVVVTTKVFNSVEGDPSDRGLAPDRVRRQIRGSLERLGIERIDLYLTHASDPDTAIEDTLVAFHELLDAGVVRAIGLSNVGAPELEAALRVAPIACVQSSYSLLDRTVEDELLPLCAHNGVAFTAHSPLCGGWLTGKYRRDRPPPDGSRMTLRPGPYEHLVEDATFDAIEAFAAAADARGLEPATLAFAWLLADERVTSVVIGPRRPGQLETPLAALDVRLTRDERDELAALFPR
jgi:aryl-alcohol dehydrogenase-like predicted oxidoreductase